MHLSNFWHLKLGLPLQTLNKDRECISQGEKKATELKQKIKPNQAKPVLIGLDAKKHLKELHRKFDIVINDKASNGFAFICRKYCISKLLAKVSPNKNKNMT